VNQKTKQIDKLIRTVDNKGARVIFFKHT